MTSGMACAVVIPCHNEVAMTRACLQSLLAQRDAGPLEITVVDNASTDATPQIAAEFPDVRVVRLPENRGFAGGVNAGIAASGGDEVLILNNDTRAATRLVAELRRVLHSDPGIGAVAPTSNHVKGPARLPLGDRARDEGTRNEVQEMLAAESAPMQDVETLAGLCLLVRRSTLASIGPFDERFGHGNFEDDDYCLRMRLHGHRLVIARRAFLHHEGHATFRALGLPIAEQLARRRTQFVRKWQHDPAGRATIAAMHGDLAGAARAAADAARRWPRWADAHLHLARGLDAAGDPAAATHWLALLTACPNHSEAAVALAAISVDAGDDDAAAARLAWAATACPWHREQHLRTTRAMMARAERRGRPEEAIAQLQAATELLPEDGALRNELGVRLLAADQVREARDAFAAAFELGQPIALSNLGVCEFRLGNLRHGLDACSRAAALLPDDATAMGNLRAARALAAEAAHQRRYGETLQPT